MKLISLKQPPKVRSVWRAVLVGVVAQPLVVLLLSAVYWALRPFVWAAVYSEPYRPPPGPYPRQNGLAVALRELGRIERTLFILDWLQSVELRRVLQPVGRNPRPQFRATTLPDQRPQPGDGGHRVVEHGLSGAGGERPA